MALYRADIRVTNTGSFFPVEIQSGSFSTAKEAIQHIYNPITIKNLHSVSSGSSNFDGDSSIAATGGLIGIAFLFWIFATYTPFVIMAFSGAFGTWIAEKITGQTVMEYNEREDDSGHGKVFVVLITALILGGYGFVKGVEVQKYLNSPTPTEIKSK